MKYNKYFFLVIGIMFMLMACSSDDVENTSETIQTNDTQSGTNGNGNNQNENSNGLNSNATTLNQSDIEALLFMLEEEKLARDTYNFLSDLWSVSIFGNIANSEQAHMNAIINQLETSSIEFTILPEGEFSNSTLQNYYNQFVAEGEVSVLQAFQIGATIEDLDIVDLQEYINGTSNESLISVFEKLQCGSRNHMRSFYSNIVNQGQDYVPQFLSVEEFNSIVNSPSEQCN